MRFQEVIFQEKKKMRSVSIYFTECTGMTITVWRKYLGIKQNRKICSDTNDMPITAIFIAEKFFSLKISQCLTGDIKINNVDNDNIKNTNVILEHN